MIPFCQRNNRAAMLVNKDNCIGIIRLANYAMNAREGYEALVLRGYRRHYFISPHIPYPPFCNVLILVPSDGCCKRVKRKVLLSPLESRRCPCSNASTNLSIVRQRVARYGFPDIFFC